MALRTDLELGVRGFNRNLDRATQNVRRKSQEMKRSSHGIGASFKKEFAGVGTNLLGAFGLAGGAVGIGATVKQSLQWADDLADLTHKLNENAESLQRVDFAAQQAASVGVAQISKAMLKLEDNLGDIKNTRVSDALERIGVSAQDLVGLPLEQKILLLSDAFQTAREKGLGVADMTELMGRQASELIPLLNLSREELENLFSTAPQLADDAIQRMAALNDQFDAMILKGKAFIAQQVDRTAFWGGFLKSIVETGSLEKALLAVAEKDEKAFQKLEAKRDAREKGAKALEEARSAEGNLKEEEDAAKAREKQMEMLATLKERLADAKIDLLPDDEKVGALRDKLQDVLDESVGMFPFFEKSLEGLEKLAQSREARGDELPGEGQNSALEAFSWLEEARGVSREIADLEMSILEERKATAEKEAERIESAWEEAEKGRFELLNPEEQARELRQRLSDSLGIDIDGAADIERGLRELRSAAEAARDAGDKAAEEEALKRLNRAQEQSADFQKAALALGDGQQGAAPSRLGSVANLVEQIFDRDPAEKQIDELRGIKDETLRVKEALNKILEKMDDPAPREFPFDDFPA